MGTKTSLEAKGLFHPSKAAKETVIKLQIPQMKEQFNNSEFILILDLSGSMGDYVNQIITRVMPKVFDLLKYPENKKFYFIGFESYIHYYEMTKNDFLNSKIECMGGTSMQNIPSKLETILNNLPTYSSINILALSNGEIEDQTETKNNTESLIKKLNGHYNNINSKAILFMSKTDVTPDTLALCSFLQFNSLENSNEKNLNTFYPNDYPLNNDEIDDFSNLIASLFPNFLSEWEINSKEENLRFEPKGKTFKNLKLTTGKHTVFVDNVYDNLDNIVTLSSSQFKNIDLINNDEVTQNNLYKVYDQVFENIINQVVENKVLNTQESNNKVNNYIKYIENIENNTKGNKTGESNEISTVLNEVKNEKNMDNINGEELKKVIEKRKNRCRKQLQKIIKFKSKTYWDKNKYEIIVLMDSSKYMQNYIDDFVQNILTEVFISIGLNEKDNIRLFCVNNNFEETNIQIKKLRNYEIECRGERELFYSLNSAGDFILNSSGKNYILITILSGELKDSEDVRILAYKMLGLNRKTRIISRLIKYITDKSDFPKINNSEIDKEKEDIITYGLIKQLNTEGMKDYSPLVLKESESKINKITKIVKLLNIELDDDSILKRISEFEEKNKLYKLKGYEKKESIKEEETIEEIKSIYINYINKKFPINILNYNSIEDLKKEIKKIFHLKDINNDQMILFFEKINVIGNIEIENNDDLENIKKEKEGNLILKIRKSYNKQDINLIQRKIEYENEINESEKIKNIILKDKKYYKEKLIETQKVLKENYLYFKKYNENNIEENDEEMKKQQDSILCLLSNVLESKGVETAIYKEKQANISSANIQKICSGLSDKKKYTFHFDFGEEKNKEIMNNINKFNEFAKKYKEKIAKKMNINPDNIIFSNPRKGSIKIDTYFMDSVDYEVNQLKSKFSDWKELIDIQRVILMQGCQLDRSIFDERGNNKDGGWGIGEYRGGEQYIPPIGWTGYGLKVMGKYDNGNDDWLSYNNSKNEYAIAYYPIKDFLQNSEDMKQLIESIAKSIGNKNINNFDSHDIFVNEKNVNKRSNNNYKKCGTGTFLFQDIKIAEANSSEVNVGGAKYKILFMCRVKPDEIRKPESFDSLWILNSDSKSIRQYRILIKIEKNDIPFTSGTLTLFKQPTNYYKNLMMNKNTSFYSSSKLANSSLKSFSEKVIYLYTTNEYTAINGYLRTGNLSSNYTEDDLKSWVWCLHLALTNYQGDKNKIGIVSDDTVVYRGCSIPFDKNKYPVGSQFYFGEFISTSKNKEVAISFGGIYNLMVITIKNNKKKNYCYYVKNISHYQAEEEVIITAFCNFLITKYENYSGQNIIYLICLGYVLNENNANNWPSLS